jgi:hypothetical protein
MNIGERLNFNSRLMEFCLGQSKWTHKEDQHEALDRYSDCLAKTIIAEQLFRSELARPRPGWYKGEPEDDDE